MVLVYVVPEVRMNGISGEGGIIGAIYETGIDGALLMMVLSILLMVSHHLHHSLSRDRLSP